MRERDAVSRAGHMRGVYGDADEYVNGERASWETGATPEQSESSTVPNIVRIRGLQRFLPDTFERWLFRPEPFLEGRRPIDVIHAGDIPAVLHALDAIAGGDFA